MERNVEREDRSSLGVGLVFERAFELSCELACDVEAETGAADAASLLVVQPDEALEDGGGDDEVDPCLVQPLLLTARRQAQLELVDDDRRQVGERRQLLLGELPRLRVDHVQGAEVVAVARPQGDAGAEAEPQLAADEGIRQGARVDPGVGYDPGLVAEDRGGPEAGLAVDLLGVEPVVRLEPDPVEVDDADGSRSARRRCVPPAG
jgi:hypothetical protein